MKLKQCRHCKKEFKDIDLILEFLNIYGSQYYTCLKCLRERMKKYRSVKKNRLKNNQAVYRSIKKLQYKQDARVIVRDALRTGKIVKPKKCKGCGKKVKLSAHHKNYSKPLKVDWLCGNCHRLEHRKLKHEQRNNL